MTNDDNEDRPVHPPVGLPHPHDLGDDDGLALPVPVKRTGASRSAEPEPEPEPNSDEKVMSLVEHLTELRWRIIMALLGITACGCVTLWNMASLTLLITRTAPKVQFIALTPVEVFFTEFKIGLISAVILAIPIIFWQIWEFVKPGLKPAERKWVWFILPAATLLFAIGALFAFLIVIPFGVEFLSSFSLEKVHNQYSLEAYTSFVLFFILSFGLIFESPLVLLGLAKIGLVTREGLEKRRRIVILGCFIVAAVLTPTPDMINQTLMAVPMWLLYEATLLVMRVLKW